MTGGGAFDPIIGVEEMRDTLLFYRERDAAAIARERDMQRMMGGLPPSMAAMGVDGAMPSDLGTFAMPPGTGHGRGGPDGTA